MPHFHITYFLKTKPLGTVEMDHNYNLWSMAFFCPRCGEIWGRIHVHEAHSWQTTNRYCFLHRDLPESLWDDYAGMFRSNFSSNFPNHRSPDMNLVPFLPKEVLVHDFLIATTEKPNAATPR